MKLLENTQMLWNCLRQDPGLYYAASSHVKKIVLGTTH